MRCTMTGDAYTVYGYGGQAGARQHPLRRHCRRVQRLPPGAACGRGVQHRRRPAKQLLDARGDRAVRGDRRPRTRLELSAKKQDRRPPLVDLATSSRSVATTRTGDLSYGVEDVLQQIHDRNADRLARETEALGRASRPTTRRLDRRDRRVARRGAGSRADPLRDHRRSTTPAATAPAMSSGRSKSANPNVRCVRSRLPPGFGHAVRAGLDALHRRRRRDHDGRPVGLPEGSRPATTVSWSRATTARSARASGTAGGRSDYPTLKLILNRLVNAGIRVLFSTATTTRRTPSRPTAAR